MMRLTPHCLLWAASVLATVAAAEPPGSGGDWPQWGRDGSRNMVSRERGLPASFEPGRVKRGGEDIDPATTRDVRWVVKLGSQSYGNPTVAGGRVFVGTNNESPRDSRFSEDRAVLMVFDARSGRFLWQLPVPKLGSGKVNDWEFIGLCSSPTVEGKLAWLVTNRGEVLALDVHGQADGNDGPYRDEGQYLAGPGNPAVKVLPTDADIVWRFDMIEELGVFPHNATSSSVLVVGSRLYVTTSNGVDWTHTHIPSPRAPALIVLDKRTGRLLGEEASGISSRMLHSNWSSPAYRQVGAKGQLVFGGGDGFLYGFAPEPVAGPDGLKVLRELWRYDANPAHYRVKDGKALAYATRDGPSEVIATPVIHEGHVCVGIGQDPEHGSGAGHLLCMDPARGEGDLTATARLWSTTGVGRSLSTVAISNGLLYTADFDGRVYCFDVKTGELQWKHDSFNHIWGSPLVADGKVYVGNEAGELLVFAEGRQLKLLHTVQLDAPVYATPVAARGVLYVATQTHLYAVGGASPPAPPGGPSRGQEKKP